MSMNLESMSFSELATLARQIEETKRNKYDECVKDWFSAIDIFKDLFIFEPSDFFSHYMYVMYGTHDFEESDMEWLNLEHIITDKSIAHLEDIEWVRLPKSINAANSCFYKDSYDGLYHITYHSFETIRIKPASNTLKYIQHRLNANFVAAAMIFFQKQLLEKTQ